MSEQLKPCPFCGEPADIDGKPGATGEQYWPLCVNDECVIYAADLFNTFATRREAIAAWNRRASNG